MQEPVSLEKEKDYRDILKKENIIMLFSCIALGIVLDILFYGKTLGISYPIYVIAFYGVLFWNLKGKYSLKPSFGWLLTIPIFLLSLTYLLFSNNIFGVLNFLAIPLLVLAQTILITGNNKYQWHTPQFVIDILSTTLYRLPNSIPKPFTVFFSLIRTKTNPEKYNTVKKVAIGLAISLPLLVVIISLLSSADQVFNHFVGEIPQFFEELSLGEFIARTLIVVIFAVLTFSFFWVLREKHDTINSGNDLNVEKKGFLDPIIVATILITINVIYVLFTVIQFSYLFGSIKYSLPQNFTYSEYARRGFFELLLVTLINFSILLGNINFLKKGGKGIHRFLQVLNSLLVLCTMVMLFSAHFRMSLYEEVYGYTYLRMLTHAFMVFLLVLFIIALYKIWYEKISLLKPYIVVALAAYLVINYLNIDVIIAKNNIARYEKTKEIDVRYMTYLSYDVVDEMIVLLESKDDEVAVLAENVLFRKKENLADDNRWQSFNLSKYRAKVLLDKHELKYREIDESGYSRDY